jgi:hypothetical protein
MECRVIQNCESDGNGIGLEQAVVHSKGLRANQTLDSVPIDLNVAEYCRRELTYTCV